MKILGIRVDDVDMVQALCFVERLVSERRFGQIITLNAEILYLAQKNAALKSVIENAAMVTPDGSGILWASRTLGQPLKERVTGIDLMQEICRQARYNGWKIFLLGGAPGVAETAATNMKQALEGIRIVGTQHGYFQPQEGAAVVDAINAAKPDILFAGMGAPKQEFWLASHQAELNVPVLVGVGGSFDVVAGNVRRAPAFFQRIGMEWFWRLCLEPKRLKRVLVLPRFMLAVRKSKWRMAQNRAEQERARQQKSQQRKKI